MEPPADQTPVVAIVGETGSGKSALALELAQRFNGEIVAADSRTIYTGMDVGTAKPSAHDRGLIRHYLLDLCAPDQVFTAVDFKAHALQAIAEIGNRKKVALLVGGSGLYVDALLYDFSFAPKPSPKQRQALQGLSVDQMQEVLRKKDLPLPRNARNPRHLMRAIETNGEKAQRSDLRPYTIIIGLTIDRGTLEKRIRARVQTMFEQGFVEEVQRIVTNYSQDAHALRSPGYMAVLMYLRGEVTLEQAQELCVRSHLQLARRQRTWFKRNSDIQWICKKEEAVDLITTFLNK